MNIFDESQIELRRLDNLTEVVEIRTCYYCDCGCDVNNMEYIKVPDMTLKMWVCNECLTNNK